MKTKINTKIRLGSLAVVAAALSLGLSAGASADVVGRLRIHVETADKKQPLSGVSIRLADSAGIRPTYLLKTDSHGNAVSPLLENRGWQITGIAETQQNHPADRNGAKADDSGKYDLKTFAPDGLQISITADAVTEVTFSLNPAAHRIVTVSGAGNSLRRLNVSNSYRRDRNFILRYPVTAGNPQDLQRVLQTVPGFSR